MQSNDKGRNVYFLFISFQIMFNLILIFVILIMRKIAR